MPEMPLQPAADPHEHRDVHRPSLLLFATAFVAFLVVSVTTLWLLFGIREGGFAAAHPIARLPAQGELGQRQQLAAYLARQQASLEELRWLDAAHTHAKIPIDDAMALLARKEADR